MSNLQFSGSIVLDKCNGEQI